MLMRIILVRHYKTLCNVSDEIMGWGDAPRAKDWEGDLAYVDTVLRQRRVQIDAIHCSCLERARQTAMYYARRRGISLIRDSAQLNEINYGTELVRKSKAWVAENLPLHKKDPDKDPDFVYPNGESFRQMQARSVKYILSLADRYQNNAILVIAHAGVIRGLVCHVLKLDYASSLNAAVPHKYIGDFQLTNGTTVSYDELGMPSGFVEEGNVSIATAL